MQPSTYLCVIVLLSFIILLLLICLILFSPYCVSAKTKKGAEKKYNYELIEAIQEKDIKKIKKAIRKGGNINYCANKYPLHLPSAVWTRNHKIVKLLIDKGAEINKKDCESKKTPLNIAIQLDNLGIVKLLVENGANVKKCYGYTSKSYELFNYLFKNGAVIKNSTLHFVHDIRIAQILLDNRVDINARISSGTTALHIAVQRNNIAYAEFLLKNGAKVNLRTKKPINISCCGENKAPAGSTALTIAMLLNNRMTVKLLKKYGGSK